MITAFNCPGCKRTVPLDHFATTECGVTAVHPDYINALLADRNAQEKRSGVRVTMGLGCPRASAIMDAENVAIDPNELNAMMTGSAWHALMESGCTDTQPAHLGAEIEVSGVIAGIPVTGKIDRAIVLPTGELAIQDWKHSNDFVRKYSTEPKSEHIVQVSIYCELYVQQFGMRPTVGMIWQHYTTSPPFIVHKFEPWDLVRCLAHHPYGSELTVQELYQLAATYYVDGNDWRGMELVGEGIKFGAKTGCDYCAVRAVCRTAANKAPF